MRKSLIILLSVGLIFSIFPTSNVFAQEGTKRVIEESLVLKDPTVTDTGKWVIGGALEYWYSKGSYDKYDANGVLAASGDIKGGMPGGNIFFGYGDFTLNYAYRKGSWDIDSTYTSGMLTRETQDQKEQEGTLRWLIRGLSSTHFTPYLLAGYSKIDLETAETISNNWIWVYNHGKTYRQSTTFKGPLLGIGGIVPINEYVGFRLDGRVHYTEAEMTRDDGKKWTGNGYGYSFVGTAYVNIWEGLNLQVGGKYLKLNGGSDIGWWDKGGVFAMLGYSYKF